MYDLDDHEAQFAAGFGDSNPGPGDVGAYLGSQNAAANLIPEPNTLAIVLVVLGLLGTTERHNGRRRNNA
jgi:hypothetical protein